ncbi:MAG: isoleucine--tRNA ligase [Myxococcota bacterium]|nr:isoleucine--tRNA ligase [Myxococcota bacterium]
MSKSKPFRGAPTGREIPQMEVDIMRNWRSNETFKRSVDDKPEANKYVFYDGPPFATGLPHYGHLVASTIKDIVPRYWAMRGHRIERRFGWDTHGLPIEMLMEKQLGLSGPSSIREFGVAAFNEACRANVLRYTEEWEKVIERLGRWVDFENDYKTMDATFMESVWWVFKSLWDKGLVYKDFRVMPYSWRLCTSLSNFEANSDYRDVQDPAVTVAMPVVGASNLSLLIWTTTPWTLPSNLAIAVGPEMTYVRATRPDDPTTYILAEQRVEAILGADHQIVSTCTGADLVGLAYEPIFDYFADHENSFKVIAGTHVTTDDGTGLVHMAPDFGEDDFEACKAAGIRVVLSVDDEGCFVDAVRDFAGQNVKAADPEIIKMIKGMGRMVRHDTIVHSYPYCWRSETPLIYKAVPARFVKVTALKDRMVAHNEKIHWVPEAVGTGRFGNWLADARDWNVSRNRFWGTPIPIWQCEECEDEVCVGSIAELEALTGETVTDLHPHKIDHLTMECPSCGGRSRRISDVFDCWFESGAMPYAQSHYPFEGSAEFESNFPAQFIAEGLDQTRGWFYTLLVLSTALFDKPPFLNCVVNGMVLAEDRSKMSKSKQNYPPVDGILNEYGADALRAYLINSPVVRAEPLAFSEGGVKEVVRTVLIPLINAWSFFVQYANVDGWSPDTGLDGVETPEIADRSDLDRWLLSIQQSLVAEVNQQMEGYYLFKVVPPILGFIDHLTNWYIRRSRRRFWRNATTMAERQDKAAAYATLYEALVTFAQVLAPVMPFISEALYQALVVEPGCAEENSDSVHLCTYPEVRPEHIDRDLESAFKEVRRVVSMGRALRERHRLKTRQPLRRVTLVHHDSTVLNALRHHEALIMEELNVKSVTLTENDADLATLSFKANFKTLGRRMGKKMKAAAAQIAQLTTSEWSEVANGGSINIEGEAIGADDIIVNRSARDDVVIEVDGALIVALDHTLDDALITEGLARDLTSQIQNLRRKANFEITDRIRLTIGTTDPRFVTVFEDHAHAIAEEVLATQCQFDQGSAGTRIELDGAVLYIDIDRVG